MAVGAIAFADGPFLTSGTFHAIINAADAGAGGGAGYVQLTTSSSSNSTTSFVNKSDGSQDGPNAVSTDGVMLYLEQNVGATGTFTVETYEIGGSVQGSVTVNVADLPASGSPKWVFFKYSAPYVTSNGFYHNIRIKSSVNATVKVYRSATAGDWAFATRKTSVAYIPVATDTAYIVGELTGAGTGTDRYVTPGVEAGITVLVGQRGFHSAATTTWNTDAGDGLWGTGSNWNNGVPNATTSAILIGSGSANVDSIMRSVKTLDTSGFTGTWIDNGIGVQVHGNINIGNHTATGTLYLIAMASGTLTMNAATTIEYTEIDFDSGAGITLTLASDVKLGYLYAAAIDNVCALGGHRLVLTGSQSGLGMGLTAANNFTWTAGGGIDVRPLVGSGGAVTIGGASTAVMPPMTFIGLNASDALSFSARVASIASLDYDTGAITGQTWPVLGTNVAHDTTITTSDFSGGTELDATDGCTDGGGNTNVLFFPAPVANAGADQSVTLPNGAPLNGSATGTGPITYSWTKVSGPGTVTFVDHTAPTTTATFSVAGTYVLRLTATNATGPGTDDMTASVHPTDVVEPDTSRSGTVAKVALTAIDRAVVLPADTNAVFVLMSATAWTYHSANGSDWPISANRKLRLSVGFGTPLTFYARTATTATLFVYQER